MIENFFIFKKRNFNFRKSILILILLFSFFSISFAYPSFEFTKTQISPDDSQISAKASYGTKISLYINGNFYNRVELVAPAVNIILDGDIQNYNVPYSSLVTVKNNLQNRKFDLNITGIGFYSLNYGESLSFRVENFSDISYKDENTGQTRKFKVTDNLGEINYTSDILNYLKNGDNNLVFKVESPYNKYLDIDEYSFTLNYNKYTNRIVPSNYTNISNKREIIVSGSVDDSNSKLYYILNYEGEIANIGALIEVPLNGSSFNARISGLIEGENKIRFITLDPNNNNNFNGEKTIKVFVDTIDPEINIEKAYFRVGNSIKEIDLGSNPFLNQNGLILNISTDAKIINVSLNGKNKSYNVRNNSVQITLNLKLGKNNLTLYATDEAGNFKKEAHAIYFDNRVPKIETDSLKPKELFQSGKAHFPFQQISGKTNKGNVEVSVFTIPQGEKTTCSDIKDYYIRQNQLTNSNPKGPEVDPKDVQFSLLSILGTKKTFTTDENGNFKDIFVVLQEKSFTNSDVNRINSNLESKNNPKVQKVTSRNKLCFVLKDKYGNINDFSKVIELDQGNTLWKPSQVTSIPNTIYAGEIEQTGDIRNSNGATRFSIIAKFNYEGDGKVKSISKPTLSKDLSIRVKDKKNLNFKIINNEMTYVFDKETNELVMYIPVEVYPLKIDPLDYPRELKLNFKLAISYDLEESDIPIDTINPIYFKASVNIEKPLDHTKWLTPKMLNNGIKFLNKTLKYTKKAKEYLGFGVVGGVLACEAAKWYYTAQLKAAQTPEEKADIQRNIYMVCDRIYSTVSPKDCSDSVTGDLGNRGLAEGVLTVDQSELSKTISSNDLSGVMIRGSENSQERIAIFNSLSLGGRCDYDDGDDDKSDGVLIRSAEISKYSADQVSSFGQEYKEEGKKLVTGQCVKAKEVDGKIKIDLQSTSGLCFSKGAPRFDETRCNFFGADKDNGVPNMDPGASLYESIRCGSITDTYSHVSKLNKILEGIKGCLEQAKVGAVKGSYCERLLSQAVCDVGTNYLFRSDRILGSSNSIDREKKKEKGFFDFLKGQDKNFNSRYKGTFYSQAGLTSNQVVKNVCIAAISGDWSALTENILAAADKNQIKPTFGPAFPESRLSGYNPMTGDLTIQYRFTYGGVSGGQRISTEVILVCDPQAPNGEYCPADGYIESTDPRVPTQIRKQVLTIPAGGGVDKTVVLTDKKAKFWFNKLILRHKYKYKDEIKINEYSENIEHKSNLFGECYFTAGMLGSGAGFSCRTVYGDNSIISGFYPRSGALIPDNKFYPGNPVNIKLDYDVRGQLGSGASQFDLVYKVEYPSYEGKGIFLGFKTIDINSENTFGSIDETLFILPKDIGEKGVNKFKKYRLELGSNLPKGTYKLKVKSLKLIESDTFNIVGSSGFEIGGVGDLSGVSKSLAGSSGDIEITSFDTSSKIPLGTTLTLDVNVNSEVNIVLVDNEGNEIGSFGKSSEVQVKNYNKFDSVQYGSGKITIKLVKPGEGVVISSNPEAFDNYNPLGDNVLSSSNLKKSEIELNFNIVKGNDDSPSLFSIISPINNEVKCVKTDGSGLAIKYLYQTATTGDKNEKLKYTLSFDRLTISKTGEKKLSYSAPNSEGEVFNGKGLSSEKSITFEPLGEFGKINETYNVKLDYEVIDKNGNKIKTGRIPFKIYRSENCKEIKTIIKTGGGIS